MLKNIYILVSGNAVDEKNVHPGGRKLIFFNQFSGDILFSSLDSFAFFISLFFWLVSLIFEIKSIYSDTHSTMRVGEG